MPMTRIPRTQSAMGFAARTLVERLRQLKVRELVTYTELKGLVGMDIQYTHRGVLNTAVNYCWEVLRIGLETDRNVGIVRLTEAEKIPHASRRRQQTHRHASKTVRRLETTDHQGFTPLQEHYWLTEISINAAVSLATHDSTAHRIETQQTPALLQIDPRDYVGLFKGL